MGLYIDELNMEKVSECQNVEIFCEIFCRQTDVYSNITYFDTSAIFDTSTETSFDVYPQK